MTNTFSEYYSEAVYQRQNQEIADSLRGLVKKSLMYDISLWSSVNIMIIVINSWLNIVFFCAAGCSKKLTAQPQSIWSFTVMVSVMDKSLQWYFMFRRSLAVLFAYLNFPMVAAVFVFVVVAPYLTRGRVQEELEIPQIRAACAEVCERPPHITLILVNKRINTRYVPFMLPLLVVAHQIYRIFFIACFTIMTTLLPAL